MKKSIGSHQVGKKNESGVYKEVIFILYLCSCIITLRLSMNITLSGLLIMYGDGMGNVFCGKQIMNSNYSQ